MAKIDENLLRKIINTYRSLPLDVTSSTSFINDIYGRIELYRVKAVGLADENAGTDLDTFNPMTNESFCHTFYRMLGLPVVNNKIGDFYNPGYYAPDLADHKSLRNMVNKTQDLGLNQLERARESISSTNISKFLSKTDEALEYKLEMLKNPRSVIVMQETTDPFKPDPQKETIKERQKFSTVQHILRPFRCTPFLSPSEGFAVAKKNLAAPFYVTTVDSNIESYSKCYLETVCKIRFSTMADKTTKSTIPMLSEALNTIQINGTNVFQNVLGNQTVIETYTLAVMMGGFVQACLDYAGKVKEYKNLAAKYDDFSAQATYLTYEIEQLESTKLSYEGIQTFIPTERRNINSNSVKMSNIDDGVLVPTFMTMLNSPVRKVDQMLNEKKQKKAKHMGEINNLSSEMFNLTGEVYGIGALEAMAMMIAFWSISQDSLISMLDVASFNRLYKQNPTLRNETVLSRHNSAYYSAPKDIITAITEFDSVVYNLLSLADAIISYSYKQSQT